MRILFFANELFANTKDSKVCLDLLTQYSQRKDHVIDVIAAEESKNYRLLKLGDNVFIHCLPFEKKSLATSFSSRLDEMRYKWNTYAFAKSLIKNNQYDLAHCFNVLPAGIVAKKIKQKFKIPYIISLREKDVIEKEKHRIIKMNEILDDAYFSVANTDHFKQAAIRFATNKELTVIHDGINTLQNLPVESIASGNFKIICGDEIIPTKGIRILIQAVSLLIGRYPQIRLLVVGEGAEKQSLMDLSRALGSENNVQFLGAITEEEKANVYSQAQIFVSPMLEGRMDQIMLDCLALGMPILATNMTFVGEYLENGRNGYILKIGDYNDILEKIEKLILDKNLLAEMANQSKIKAQSLSKTLMADKYLELSRIAANLGKIKQGQ